MDRKKLYEETRMHKIRVAHIVWVLGKEAHRKAQLHDDDKLEDLIFPKDISNEFFEFAKAGFKGPWWDSHKGTDHHEPKNLFDLIEKIVDCVSACVERTGSLDNYRPLEAMDLMPLVRTTEEEVKKIYEDVYLNSEEGD